jgi:dTDP-4-amino-4,6-dideoxygalactose transaminase
LDDWNARRSKIAAVYLDGLKAESGKQKTEMGIRDSETMDDGRRTSDLRPLNSGLILPHVPSWASPVWHLFVIRHPQRNALQQQLAAAGIGTLIHYPVPPHLSGAYAAPRPPSSAIWNLPIAEQLADTVLSLPMWPHLSQDEARCVVNVVREVASSLAP